MSGLNNIFDVGARSMASQMVRMNALASNIANADSVSSTAQDAYRPMRPVFETQYGGQGQTFLAAPHTLDVVPTDRPPVKLFQPDHPLADEDGFIFRSGVNPQEEMVEMLEAGRQYQNTLEAVSTLRTLMARTVAMGK